MGGPGRTQSAQVARDFIAGLVRLHALPIDGAEIPDVAPGAKIADCVS